MSKSTNKEHVAQLYRMANESWRGSPEFAALIAAIAALSAPQPPAEAHCATCSCVPGMTPAVRFDTTPAEKEGAVRDHLIRMGWTPPAESQPMGAAAGALKQAIEEMEGGDFGGGVSHACLQAMKAALTQQLAYDGGFTAADMMDARLEGRREACPKCDDNVAHATEALREQREFQAALIEELLPYQDEAVASRAEIEALRMEIKGHRLAIQQLYDRAERLAEALREAYGQVRELCDCYGHAYPEASFAHYEALLRDYDKEEK